MGAGPTACIATSGTASGSTESVRRAESVAPPMPTKIQMSKMVPSRAAITLNVPDAVSRMDDGGPLSGIRNNSHLGHRLSRSLLHNRRLKGKFQMVTKAGERTCQPSLPGVK